MAKNQVITPVDAKSYSKSFDGRECKILVVKGNVVPGQPIAAANLAARASGMDITVDFSMSNPDEINTDSVQETNYSRQELGRGTLDLVYTLKANDQLPTHDSLRQEPELTIIVLSADDSPLTVAGVPVVMDVLLGVRFSGKTSNIRGGQNRQLGVPFVFRQHKTGADWKQIAGDSVGYPASVSAA